MTEPEVNAGSLGERPTSGDHRERAWAPGFPLQLAIAAISITAVNALRPMVSYRALGLGAGPLEIGIVQSAFSIVPALIAVALGSWIDRFGEGRFLAIAMALIALGSGVATLAGSLAILALANAIVGFGQVTNLVAGQAMIANRGPRDRREHRYGWYSTVASLGQLLGPAIAALLVGASASATIGGGEPSPSGNPQAPVFLFALAAASVASVLALRLPLGPRRRPIEEPSGPASGLAATAWLVLRRPGMAAAMLVSITVISSVDVLVAYLPAYGEAGGLSVEIVGLLLSVRAASSLVSRLFMTQLIDLLGRGRLLAVSMVLAGAAIALLPVVASVPGLFGLMVLIGLGLGLGQPMTIAWVANRSPRRQRALALGVRLTGNRAALLVVPTAMGALAGAGGITLIWLVLATFLGGGALVAARTPFDELVTRPRPAEPESERSEDGQLITRPEPDGDSQRAL